MILKGVNWVDNNKIRSNDLERGQLGKQYKNQVKLSWKESSGHTMIKSSQIVLKWVILVLSDKMMSNGLERSQLDPL